jgi:hypothetical protein
MKNTLGLIGTTVALTAAGAFAVADEGPSRGSAAGNARDRYACGVVSP